MINKEKVQQSLRDLSEGLSLFSKVIKDIAASMDPTDEPPASPKAKPSPQKQNAADPNPNSNIGRTLETIRAHEKGISKKDLMDYTGFNEKQIANYVMNLKKKEKIKTTKPAYYIAI